MSSPTACPCCSEPFGEDDNIRSINGGTEMAHLECIQQLYYGGIGHLENHDLWCLQQHDPYGGRTFRQSALEVSRTITARMTGGGQ